ncbi:MAG TPA: anti-sigma factor [Chthonomonadaceae bacterium]|nr:anti-sigma factor [Chthonomonadaceae bacterium]
MSGFPFSACRAVQRALWDYAYNRLSEGPLEMVERHLPTCAACRSELESVRRTQALLAAYREQPPPPPRSDWEALRKRLIEEVPAPAAREAHRQEPTVAVVSVGGARRYSRSSGIGGWLPSVAYSGGIAALLVVAALGYRLLLPRRAAEKSAAPSLSVRARSGPPASLSGNASARPSAPTRNMHPVAPAPEATDAGNDLDDYSTASGSEANPYLITASQSDRPDSEQEMTSPKVKKRSRSSLPRWQGRIAARQPERLAAHRAESAARDEGKLHFVSHKPQPTESAPPRVEENQNENLLDSITPVSQGGDTSERFVMGALTPMRYHDDSPY